MNNLLSLGRTLESNREVFTLHLEDFTSLPASLQLSSPHFIAFLVADATDVPVSSIAALARLLLNSGCVYFCAWGPDCERVHDIFDEEHLAEDLEDDNQNVVEDDSVILTTWHSDESLDEALWYFAFTAFAAEAYQETCGSALAISIGNSAWEQQVHTRLSNIEELDRAVTDGA
jgi:hypothetical protein